MSFVHYFVCYCCPVHATNVVEIIPSILFAAHGDNLTNFHIQNKSDDTQQMGIISIAELYRTTLWQSIWKMECNAHFYDNENVRQFEMYAAVALPKKNVTIMKIRALTNATYFMLLHLTTYVSPEFHSYISYLWTCLQAIDKKRQNKSTSTS